jgi:hypothetical protein
MLYARGWRAAWGTVPDWLGAAGALATVLALVVAWLVYRHDINSHREDREHEYWAERRKQAENITAWLGSHTAVDREVIARQGPGCHQHSASEHPERLALGNLRRDRRDDESAFWPPRGD